MTKPPTTILGGKTMSSRYIKSEEEVEAKRLKNKCEHQLSRCNSMQRFALSEALKFEVRIIDFCLDNNISLFDPNYKEIAISLAARQHPKLDTKRKPSHRPKKQTGVLVPKTRGAMRLELVEAEIRNSDGVLTQKAAIELLKRQGNPLFLSSVKTIEIAISQQKKIRNN